MKPITKIENLGKRYRIGAREAAYGTLRESIVAAVRNPILRLGRRRGTAPDETIWALQDINLEIRPGEVMGIIGRNGAGKSTLLKILSRITEPTTGRIELYGRVGSLLEVGTGFHPELTGRENIFLNGAILGMRKAEIDRKFDQIVDFAELETFLDTPVKRYSSGMYVRLAFSVAAHLEPEIMVIDEVLSVGDMAFQQKCLQKIRQMRELTKTIILVSHSMISVRAICSRVVLLSEGRLAADGELDAVIPLYEKLMLERNRDGTKRDEIAEGTGQIQVDAVRLLDESRVERQNFETGEKVTVVVEYDAVEQVKGVIAYAAIRRPDNFICVGTSTRLENVTFPPLEGPGRIEIEIPELLIMPGHYVMDIIFYDTNYQYRAYFLGRRRVEFTVSSKVPALDGLYGVVYQKYDWKIVDHREGTEREPTPLLEKTPGQ